jgi:hypothetical protein
MSEIKLEIKGIRAVGLAFVLTADFVINIIKLIYFIIERIPA